MHGYDSMYNFQNLYNAHLAARRGKRYKTDVIQFEMNLAQNLCILKESLADRTYTPQGYFHFTIHDPKTRLIYAPSYADRVVQHCLCDNIIMPTLETRLIYDNAACRLDKGTHFSLYRLSGFMRRHYSRFGANGFFLKCDVHKYFETIDHAILKQKLLRVFDDSDSLTLMFRIIDSFENTPGKGLPLGNQTSQWFALLYLDAVDRLIKEKLGIKHYVRYMDDFVLLHNDKAYLQECLCKVKATFKEDLLLDLNKKTQICPIKNGVSYLGWHLYLTDSGKVVRKLMTSAKNRTKRRFRRMKNDYADGSRNLDDIKRSLTSTHGHLIHGHTYKLRKALWNRLILVRHKQSC